MLLATAYVDNLYAVAQFFRRADWFNLRRGLVALGFAAPAVGQGAAFAQLKPRPPSALALGQGRSLPDRMPRDILRECGSVPPKGRAHVDIGQAAL